MATLTSQLVIELLDRVTSPARRAANALAGISNRITEANGQPITFGDRLDAAMARNSRSLEAARGNLVDAAAGFYALKTAIAGPVQEAMAFEEAMADVRKVVDFPTPEGFAQFQRDLFALSRDVPVAVDGLAQIAAAAGAAGIAGDDLVRFTEAASKIGVAFDISADDAGDAMAKMMTGLGLTIDEAVSLTDAMNHLSNAQASSASEILDVVRRVGAQGKMFGFTAEETAAFGSAMIAAGAQSDVAATSFNNMGKALTRGAAATKGQNEAFKTLGLDAEEVAKKMQEDAVGTTVSVLEAIARLPKEQQAAISSQLFGDEARALGPLLTNLDLVRSSMGLVADESQYAGSAFKEFEARNRTFSSALQRLRNRLSELSITIGSALLPALDQMVAFIGPIITKIADLASQYPNLTAAIVGATAAVVAFKVAMAGLAYMGLLGRGGVLSLIAAGYNTIGRAAIYATGAARSAVALQNALIPGGRLAEGFMGPTRMLTGWQRLGVAVRGVVTAIPGLGAIATAAAGISAPVWGTFAAIAAAVAAAGLLIYRYWDRISAVFAGVGQAIGEALQPGLEWVGEKLAFLNPVVDAFGAAWGAVRERLSGLGEMIGGLFTREVLTEEQTAGITARAREVTENIIGFFTGIPARLGEVAVEWFNAGRDLIQSLWDGMVQIFTDLQAWIDGRIDALLQPLRDARAALANLNPFGGGGDEAVDGTRARGGPISRGGTYLVGEEGPELITANRNGYVHPAGQGMEGSAPAPGPTTVSPNFEVSISIAPTINTTQQIDPGELAETIGREMSEKVREAFRGVFADTGMRFA